MSKTEFTTIKDVTGAAVDTVLAAKQKAQDLGRSMAGRLDEMKSQSVDALGTGADTVRGASQRGATVIADAGERVAAKLDAASSYVDAIGSGSLTGTLRGALSRHPVSCLIMATAFGFCAGAAISRGRTMQTNSRKKNSNEETYCD